MTIFRGYTSRLKYSRILLLVVWAAVFAKASGQSFEVKYIRSWPSEVKGTARLSFKEKISSIVFGAKKPSMLNPLAIWAYDTNNFFVLDQGNQSIFGIKEGVGEIPHPFQKTEVDLSSLVAVTMGPGNNYFITNSRTGKILIFNPKERKLKYFNDTLVLDQPTGIGYLPSKNEIWVLETKKHWISVYGTDGNFKRHIGRRGTAPGCFNYPTHLWIGKDSLIYINDAMNFRIQVFSEEGDVVSWFGETGDATGFMARPKGIATDSHGNIYVVDALFHAVQVFNIKGNFLYTFGTQGHKDSEFWLPSGIFIDSHDFIYVADTYNARVQLFQLLKTP